VLTGCDANAARWVARYAVPTRDVGLSPATQGEETSPSAALADAIDRGDVDGAPRLVDEALAAGLDARDVISGVLTPAIQRLGDAYGRGEVFLPQMIVAADAMKAAVARARTFLPAGEEASAGRVAFATVEGDVHSIGKDICISLLESHGWDVDDLGVDVDVRAVLEAASTVDVVCLSALMTTTLPAMERTVSAVKERLPGVRVLVGGAVVTREYAAGIGADGYAVDAPGCVDAVRLAVEGARG
jgi:5-methyltetrahydrofolate--homocysteine methyltransferase